MESSICETKNGLAESVTLSRSDLAVAFVQSFAPTCFVCIVVFWPIPALATIVIVVAVAVFHLISVW